MQTREQELRLHLDTTQLQLQSMVHRNTDLEIALKDATRAVGHPWQLDVLFSATCPSLSAMDRLIGGVAHVACARAGHYPAHTHPVTSSGAKNGSQAPGTAYLHALSLA